MDLSALKLRIRARAIRAAGALVLLCLGYMTVLSSPAEAKRVALVIANSQYDHVGKLKNPNADARLVAGALLDDARFDSVDVLANLGKAAMESALRDFSQKADGADVALIYYAGHGMEAGGQNYLIPADARLARDRDLEVEATRLDTALLMVEGAKLRIVILDACRNNPFTAQMQRTVSSRSVGRGLAAVEPQGETLVVYAAKAGATAADGSGANSPFATSLANRMAQPGLEISLLFRAVRDDVLQQTGQSQEPFTYGSLSSQAFYFVPPDAQAAAPAGGAPQISEATAEALYWQGALAANSEGGFRDYLEKYPNGTFAGIAKQNVARFAQPGSKPGATATEETAKATVEAAAAAKRPMPASEPVPGGVAFAKDGFSAVIGSVGAGGPKLDRASIAAPLVRQLAFRPDAAVRRAVMAKFVADLQASSPEMAGLMGTMFQFSDVFAQVDQELARYGLNSSNLADTTALYIDTLRDVASGTKIDPSRQQTLAVRDQMAQLIFLNPGEIPPTDAGKQELSDTMVLGAMLLQFIYESAQQDAATLQQLSQATAQLAIDNLGTDVRQLKLTDQGYSR